MPWPTAHTAKPKSQAKRVGCRQVLSPSVFVGRVYSYEVTSRTLIGKPYSTLLLPRHFRKVITCFSKKQKGGHPSFLFSPIVMRFSAAQQPIRRSLPHTPTSLPPIAARQTGRWGDTRARCNTIALQQINISLVNVDTPACPLPVKPLGGDRPAVPVSPCLWCSFAAVPPSRCCVGGNCP